MTDLAKYRARLEHIFHEITDAKGGADVKGIGGMGEVNKRIDEVRDILAELPAGYESLRERMESDPDFSRFSRKRRLEALVDYVRFAIGLIDRHPAPARGRVIVGANDD
jgi:hypothetical protein